MNIHLVAIILSNLAGFAWLVDIKHVFEKTWLELMGQWFC